jgi:FKBP-type peptidyl-prolyl cis-trans isomerase FkpA
MMLKTVFAVAIVSFSIFFAACIKDTGNCTAKSVQSESNDMITFELNNSIAATVHPSGLHYEIINPGTGPFPTATSTVSVLYKGKLLDGNTFDSTTGSTPFTYPVNGFIQGWQIGLPLIQEGGTIKLIIPSSMAYGCKANGRIPADAVLYFEITIVDVL